MKRMAKTGKRYIIPLSAGALIFFAAACQKDYLDLAPVDKISDVSAYNTPEKILSQVRALYAQLSSESFYGGRYLVFNEQRGDEFSQNDGNNSTGANVWNQSISNSGDFVNAVWSAAYRTINSANILVEKLEGSIVVDEATRNHYIAEARFIRALSYFSLVQTYARPYAQDKNSKALPLRLKGETSGGNNNLEFSTVEEVYVQILKDLDEAENNLPVSYPTALGSVSRARKAAAIALKTRVNLVKGDFAAVEREAAKIVSPAAPFRYVSAEASLALEEDLTILFSGSYTGSEAIFTIPFVLPAEAPGLQSSLAGNYLSPVIYLNTAGAVSLPELSSAASKDKRKSLIRVNANGQSLLGKFPKNSAPFLDYIPVIRYAEILLNYAEAAAANGNTEKALALLTAVRRRSDPGYTFSASLSPEELVAAARYERRIELLGEGFRTHDLFRTVKPLPAKIGNAGTAPEIAPAAANYVWPVPSNELAYNRLAPR